MAQQIKLSLAPTADEISSGPRPSSVSTGRRDCDSRPSAASPAAKPSETSAHSASAEILRARDLLRDVLLREDITDETVLLGEVSAGLNEMVEQLDRLAGLQTIFESWNSL